MVECSRAAAAGNELDMVAADIVADSTVVTYYNDVCDEVDAHFARALLQQQENAASSLPTTPSSDLQSVYQQQDSCGNGAAQQPVSFVMPESCLSPSFTDTSSSMAFSTTSPQLLNENFVSSPTNSGNHLPQAAASSFETASISPSPTLAPPSLLPTPSTLSHPPLLHQFPSTQWQNHPTILYPELSRYLVHPHIDPYSDTPRVPGQPKEQYTTPPPPPPGPDLWEPSLPHQHYQSAYPQSLPSPNYTPYSRQYSSHPYYDPPLAYSSDPYLPHSPAPSNTAVHPFNPYPPPNVHPYAASNGYWEPQTHPALTPPPMGYGSARHHVFSSMNSCQQIATLQ